MKKCQIMKTIIITSALGFIGNIAAENHHKPQDDFTYSIEKLNDLNLSSLSIMSDDQFVFNNELALMDWDTIFDGFAPSLKQHQTTIMHYAGYHSINPKLLISLMEAKSGLLTNPTIESFDKPFGNLSKKDNFAEQVEDVASKLSKRFYAFRRLNEDKDSTERYLLKKIVPTSAATVAIKGLLTSDGKNKEESNDTFYNLLMAFEDVFFEHKSDLLSQNDQSINKNKKGQVSAAAAPNFYLPWTSGWSWVAGGAHGYDGSSWPLSSLDLYYNGGNTGWGGNKPNVYAAHGGTVTWLSSCQMRITHSSGYGTSYYHMDNLQYSSGTYINAGTYIGAYANNKSQALCEGGSSTGPHLHMSLYNNGYWQSLQGFNFSGYYVQVGTSQYDSNCSRNYLWKNGTTYCAGNNIYKPYE